MADPDRIRTILKLVFDDPGGNVGNAHEIYHDDAVLEFPQSGERFEGVDAFTAWGQYPSEVTFHIRRTVVFENFSLVELSGAYDRAPRDPGRADPGLPGRQGDPGADLRHGALGGPEWRAPWRSEVPAEFG